ncbi:MAG: hypothetical protein RMH93_03790 [Aquificaceae bacterium]|nr:hypothetical protein [Aquificaceae bacterium]MCS7195808.1 hypothetical protein [Aquificaceae bacterium]MDW8032650.1 hypothetical protein [Aquificaceae bacterium]MDW8293768.1 hypothetical protein [Aquificaceae bacterium]
MRFEDFREFLEECEPFSKGWRGLVFRSRWQGMEVAVKVARDREREHALRKEGDILKLLKGIRGFPQLLHAGEDFIVYKFIEGVPFEKVLMDRKERTLVYLKVLELIQILDRLKINKEELHRLDKNTLVGEGLEVHLVDFERGSLGVEKRHNLSQFLQLLVREGLVGFEEAKELGKRYARGEEVYREVERALQTSL